MRFLLTTAPCRTHRPPTATSRIVGGDAIESQLRYPQGNFADNYGGGAVPGGPPYVAFLGNLSYQVTEDDVRNLFSGLTIESVHFPRDNERQQLRGVGYVKFADAEALRRAMGYTGRMFLGRMLRVELAQSAHSEVGDSRADVASTWRRENAVPETGGWSERGRSYGRSDMQRPAPSGASFDRERRAYGRSDYRGASHGAPFDRERRDDGTYGQGAEQRGAPGGDG